MEFIEELIRKTLPGIENSLYNISEQIIDDYWAEVCTVENLKDYESFDEAWNNWFNDYGAHMDDIAELYYRKTKKALIWSLYDTDDVAQCLKEEFLEPILWKFHCNASMHPDIQRAMEQAQEDE